LSRKVIFTTPDLPTFVQQDIELLKENLIVVVDVFPWNQKWLYPYLFFRQFLRIIYHIGNSDALLCSFGGYWCVLPTILGWFFRKPVYIILNGTDCCAANNINYGVLRKPMAKWACKFSYANASRLLPISQSLMYFDDAYATEKVGPQGVKFHLPKISTPFDIIPYGIDIDFWNYEVAENRSTQFITVIHQAQFERRDGKMLFEIFERNSSWELIVVGSIPQGVFVPKNVQVIPWMSTSELRDTFTSSSFYIQLSLFEGFGCALTEAMACGCVPIGTAVNAVPQIIGKTGIVLNKRDSSLMEQAIQKLLKEGVSNEERQRARDRIVSNYSLDRRRKSILSLLNGND
jgi:glycosyltransferase involved in cell wall biosynthesis